MQMSGFAMHTAAWIEWYPYPKCRRSIQPVEKVIANTKDSGSGQAVN